MSRDEAFHQLANSSDEWNQKQQRVLNKIYDDFELRDEFIEAVMEQLFGDGAILSDEGKPRHFSTEEVLSYLRLLKHDSQCLEEIIEEESLT